jgi:hypothetical protein
MLLLSSRWLLTMPVQPSPVPFELSPHAPRDIALEVSRQSSFCRIGVVAVTAHEIEIHVSQARRCGRSRRSCPSSDFFSYRSHLSLAAEVLLFNAPSSLRFPLFRRGARTSPIFGHICKADLLIAHNVRSPTFVCSVRRNVLSTTQERTTCDAVKDSWSLLEKA